MSNSNPRSSDAQSTTFSRLGLDKSELKSIKVAIMRRNVSEPNTSGPLLRSLDDPADLVIHYRADEGVRPIFDREDIVVNRESNEERMILAAPHVSSEKLHTNKSRSSSPSSRSSADRGVSKEDSKKRSPLPQSSRGRSREGYRDYASSRLRRSNSHSRKSVYKSSSPPRSGYSTRRSRSPEQRRRERGRSRSPGRYYKRHSRSPGYKTSAPERRRSRSPPPKVVEKGRSPPKYRGPPERRRSRSPPPRRSSRGRSRSYSPHHRRSRYSRSPRRYERSRRSRSPRRRYTPERHDEGMYEAPRIPYFEGAEFWVPNPMLQPRFLPRQMIPPGAFPYPFRPGMPPMMPPRMPFRPRIVYNRPQRPKSTTTSSESSVVTTTTTAGTSNRNEEEQTVKITECSEENEHSSEAKSE